MGRILSSVFLLLTSSAFVFAQSPDAAAPFEFFYPLTLVNKGGTWKAVAMHSSHP
jgi:hypothetical protein